MSSWFGLFWSTLRAGRSLGHQGRPDCRGVTNDPAVFSYHLSLCEQAEFVVVRREAGVEQLVQLTWAGHKELKRLRSEAL